MALRCLRKDQRKEAAKNIDCKGVLRPIVKSKACSTSGEEIEASSLNHKPSSSKCSPYVCFLWLMVFLSERLQPTGLITVTFCFLGKPNLSHEAEMF